MMTNGTSSYDQAVATEATPDLERIVILETLAPGQYWRCRKNIGDVRVNEGHILLLMRVDDVDHQPHTLTMRYHPSVTRPGEHKPWFKIRIDDFMAAFDHVSEQDAVADRERYKTDITKKLQDLQTALARASSDEQYLDKQLANGQSTDNSAQLPVKLSDVAASVAKTVKSGQIGDLLNPALSQQNVAEVQSTLAAQQDRIQSRTDWMQRQIKNISAVANELTPYAEEIAAVAQAQMSDMRKRLKEIEAGITNLDLYTGKGIEVETIATGQSAPTGERLSIAQQILWVDEELVVFQDVDETFSYQSIHKFTDALKTHPTFIEQVCPTQRCIVGLKASRQDKRYAERGYSAMEAAHEEALNRETFLLVRDGENLHLVYGVGFLSTQLFPSEREMTGHFTGYASEEITFDSLQYTASLSSHARAALNYKRALIVIAGLDHRERLFGDFYPGPQSLEFVTLDFQSKYFRFIHDAEGEGMLPLPKDLLPLHHFVKHNLKQLIPGAHYLGNWRELFSPDSIPSAYERESAYRINKPLRLRYKPSSEVIKGIARKEGVALIDRIPVSGDNTQYQYREFNAKLSLTQALEDLTDNQKIALLCLDQLRPDQLRAYIQDRRIRATNLKDLFILKRALATLEQERLAYKPWLQQLKALLAGQRAHIDTPTDDDLHLAINRFRAAYHGQLPPDFLTKKAHQTAMIKQVVGMQSSQHHDQMVAIIQAQEQAAGRTPLRIGLDARGECVAWSEAADADLDDRWMPFAWQARTKYRATAKGLKPEISTLKSMPVVSMDLSVLWQRDTAADRAPQFPAIKSPNQKNEWLIWIDNQSWYQEFFASGLSEADLSRLIQEYKNRRHTLTGSGRYVKEPEIFFPLALRYTNDHKIAVVGLSHARAMDVLLATVTEEKHMEVLYDLFGKAYQKPEKMMKRLTTDLKLYLSEREMTASKPSGGLFESSYIQYVSSEQSTGNQLVDAIGSRNSEKTPVYVPNWVRETKWESMPFHIGIQWY